LSLAIVIACLATIGGSPLFAIILAVIVLRIRYGSQQNGLVWVLAIAAEKKLPLAAAVEEYGAECRGGYQRRVLQFADRLLSGQSLPAAIEADRQSWFSRALRRYWIFTDYVNPTIPLLPAPARVAASVGWETGTLGPALREIALARTLNRPDWHAALGRLMLLMLPLVILQHVGGFVLFFIAPKFKRIFYDFGVELPPITKIVYQVGDEIIEGNALPIVLLFELIIGVFLLASLRSAWSFWTHFPVDRLLRGLDRAVILRSLAVSVDGGQTLTVGLRALASCYPKNWVRRRLARAIEGTELGSPWAQCLGSHRLIRRADVTLLESAQRAGNLGWALRELAARAERRLAYALQLFVHVLYPVIFLGVAGLIFLFVVGYFSPLLKLIRELSG
jgi:protein transport protein HofC